MTSKRKRIYSVAGSYVGKLLHLNAPQQLRKLGDDIIGCLISMGFGIKYLSYNYAALCFI